MHAKEIKTTDVCVCDVCDVCVSVCIDVGVCMYISMRPTVKKS